MTSGKAASRIILANLPPESNGGFFDEKEVYKMRRNKKVLRVSQNVTV
jgi:hypothetical protein